MSRFHFFKISGLAMALALAGCGGDDDGGTNSDTDPDNTNVTHVQLSGKVLAPGGTVAFNPSTGLEKFFAEIFGKNAVAEVDGTAAVEGATVELIEIDESGTKVGDALGSGTTATDGTFTLELPADFTPDVKYIVRATGSGSETLDANVTSLDETLEVDPVSHAVKELILDTLAAKTGAKLTDLKLTELAQIKDDVLALESDVDLSAASNVAAFVTAFKNGAKANEEVANIIGSAVEAGEICGTVKDSSGTALKNIVVVARDYGNWVTRAKVKTDADGAYCLNVPANNDYILGALNFTGLSTAGSEWWTCADTDTVTCGTAVQLDATKITVADAALTRDFVLEPGVRVSGTVKTDSGAALRRVHVLFRTWDASIATVGQRSKIDGSYRINMRPGVYTLFARNGTRQRFATEGYNAEIDGGLNFNEAEKVDLSASSLLGTTVTANFTLEPGFPVTGVLKDSSGNPIAGERIHYRQHGTVNVRRTNKEGKFRLQLRPGVYFVLTHGQIKKVMLPYDVFSSSNIADLTDMPLVFNKDVATVKVNLKQSCGTDDEAAVSQAKAILYKGTTPYAIEPSNSDGSTEMHIDVDSLTDAISNNIPVRFVTRIDDGSMAGSIIYQDNTGTSNDYATKFVDGTNLASLINSATDKTLELGDVCLPDGGIVSGTVTNSGGEPVMNAVIQVLDCSGSNACNQAQIGMVKTRTNAEGEYKITLPAGMVAGVRVQVGRGGGVWSNKSDPVTVVAGQTHDVDLTVALPDPVGVVGEAGDTTATISWKPVPGAASYNVYMSQATGVGTTDDNTGNWMAHTSVSNPFMHESLTNGTAYYFVVTAVDADGNESSTSEEVAVTPASGS